MSSEESYAISELLTLHHSLWDLDDTVEYFGNTYEVYKPEHKGFSRAIVPGKSGKNILFITQNLLKSSYGTEEIQRAAKLGKTVRITWIVDPSEGNFKYIGVIKTTDDYCVIEKYTNFGTHIMYHSDPNYKPIKSEH
jgi:hypothetical protein